MIKIAALLVAVLVLADPGFGLALALYLAVFVGVTLIAELPSRSKNAASPEERHLSR